MPRLVSPVAAAILVTCIAARAQQPAPASAKPLVPVAASSLADSPHAYYGQYVSVVGAVEQAISPSAFSIDQDKSRATGKEILILVPMLNAPVDLNTYVTVLGEVVRFEPAELAGRINVDIAPEVVSKFRGRPAVLATAVLNTAMVDLARKPLPPLSPEEEKFDAVMKRVGPAFSALRQAMSGSDAAAAREQAGILKQAFGDAMQFWKSKRSADAVRWASDGRTHADAIERLVAIGDWEAVKTSATSLGQACQSCHGVYRERLEDGTYRIRTLTR